jgi:hypothetical protein
LDLPKFLEDVRNERMKFQDFLKRKMTKIMKEMPDKKEQWKGQIDTLALKHMEKMHFFFV